MNKKIVTLVGDVHGQFQSLINKIRDYSLENSHLICVGDLGMGFSTPQQDLERANRLNSFLKERNIIFYSIRGNHDDPTYFNGSNKIELSNFKLLEDYSSLILNGEMFLFVGGAVSIDRVIRNNYCYWEDELFVLNEEKIQDCDVLVTHSAPTWNGPFDKNGISTFLKDDPTLWDFCVKERKNHDELIEKCKCNYHYCGHFHQWYQTEFKNCRSNILRELEIVEHKPYES